MDYSNLPSLFNAKTSSKFKYTPYSNAGVASAVSGSFTNTGTPNYGSAFQLAQTPSQLGAVVGQPTSIPTQTVDTSHWYDLTKDMNNIPDSIKNNPTAIAEWMKAPTTLQSGLNAVGTGISALSGLYGMYQANKNYEQQKQLQEAQLAQARASEANRSAMAKAFGSTYTPAQF